MLARQRIQLLLGVVEIINVDDSDPEIVSAALDLILEIARSETVSARHDVRRLHYTRAEVLAVEESPITFLRSGGSSFEREVAAFGADDHLFAADATVGDNVAHGFPN